MRPQSLQCTHSITPAAGTPTRQPGRPWHRLLLLAALLPALAQAQVSVDLVSSGDPGDTGNGESPPLQTGPRRSISDDGRYSIYFSSATNLVAGVADHNSRGDVYWFDRATGVTQLVSHRADSLLHTANKESVPVAISGDGRWVTYYSYATDLVAGVTDSNSTIDVFLYDSQNGTNTLVSHAADSATITANEFSRPVGLSFDGRWLLYLGLASNLVTGAIDTNSQGDLFLYDRTLGSSVLVSRTFSATPTAASVSGGTELSADGRWIAFATSSSNIISGVTDGNGSGDIYLYDRDGGAMTLVSHAAGSLTTTANSDSDVKAVSADGRWVLYTSFASNLVAGISDGNPGEDVYVYDRNTGTSSLVSHAANSATVTANGRSYSNSISDDGRWVLYSTQASNVVAGTTGFGMENAYLHDRVTGLATLVSYSGAPTNSVGIALFARMSLSADGRFILWNTSSSVISGINNGHPPFGDDVYLFDRQSGNNTLVSGSANTPMSTGNGESRPIGISADGSSLLFYSLASDLVSGIVDSNGSTDVFLRDRVSATTQLLSRIGDLRRTTANSRPDVVGLSADARFVLVNSTATNIVAGQIDSRLISNDVFMHDTVTDQNTLISRSTAGATTTANNQSGGDAISADGRWVLFTTAATDIASGVVDNNNGEGDVFLYDRIDGQSTLISHAAGSPLTTANRNAIGRAMSSDGRWLLYDTEATNVLTGMSDTLFSSDVFLVDRLSGARTLVSHLAGSPLTTADGNSVAIALSTDGRYVLFRSDATGIIPGQIGSGAFLYDRDTGLTVLASPIAGSPVTGMSGVGDLLLSADGQTVVYSSSNVDISSGISDTNGDYDVFRFDARTGTVTTVSRSALLPNATANRRSVPKALSADGRRILYESYATDLIAGLDVSSGTYVYDHPSGQTLPISHTATSPTTPGNGYSQPSDISADGNRVLFYTWATDLLPGISDNNEANDVYVREIDSGNMTLVSRTAASTTTTGSLESRLGWFSADGQKALFMSFAADLDSTITDGNTNEDLYLATLPQEAAMFADGFE